MLIGLVEIVRLVKQDLLIVLWKVVGRIAWGGRLLGKTVLQGRGHSRSKGLDPGVVLRILVVPQGQLLPNGRFAIEADLTRFRPIPCFALEAVALQQGAFGAVHEIKVTHDGVSMLGMGRKDQIADFRILEECNSLLHTLGSLQRSNGCKVVEAVATDGCKLASPATCYEADCGLCGTFHQLGQLTGILGKGTVVDQALFIEFVDKLQAFTIGILVHCSVDFLAIHDVADIIVRICVDIGVKVTINEGIEQEALYLVSPSDDGTGEGNLVILAILVGILLLDGLQRVVELISGGGDL